MDANSEDVSLDQLAEDVGVWDGCDEEGIRRCLGFIRFYFVMNAEALRCVDGGRTLLGSFLFVTNVWLVFSIASSCGISLLLRMLCRICCVFW